MGCTTIAFGPSTPTSASSRVECAQSVDVRTAVGQTVSMSSPKEPWSERFDAGPPMHEELGRLVDWDGGRDEAENAYFESTNDPQFVAIETAQRRFRGQFRRRLRHREAKKRARDTDGV